MATLLAACSALLVMSLVPADAEMSRAPQDPGGLLAVPGGNTFPVPAPYEVSFSDSWHACRDGCSRQHKGNDLMAAEGTPVVAVESGIIAKVDGTDDGNGGLSVWLLGDSGVAYYYAHHSANLVVVDQRVARGQQIARVGHTGNARTTPSHIHFQINRCGELSSAEPCTVDPYRPLRSWPQELTDGGADALGLYTPAHATLRLRTEGGSPLPTSSLGERRGDDVPLAGDWNGDGRDTVGAYRPADATFHLVDDAGARLPTFGYGAVGDLPLAGDWNGDGRDSVGVYRPSDATFHLRDDAGRTLPAFRFGRAAAAGARADAVLPVAGDWDGDGRDTVALFRRADATFVARDDQGAALPALRYGAAGDLPLAGDWEGDGSDTVGVYRPADASYHLQGFTDRPPEPAAEADAAPAAEADTDVDVVPVAVPVPSGPVVFGPRRAPGARPVAGDWNGRDLVTIDDLHAIWGTAPDDPKVVEGLPLLNAAMIQSGVVTPARKAAFLATIRNESGFRFDAVERGRSAYRGRGFIQLTSEDNYRRAGADLGLDLVGSPGLATNPLVSSAVASWYWTRARNINLAADRLDMAAVDIAVGYRPTAREDFARCADFLRALEWFTGGTLPEGVNCERSLAALTTAAATVVPGATTDPATDPDPPPASVTQVPPGLALPPPPPPRPVPTPPTPTTGPPGPTTTSTRPPPTSTTTEPPTTSTTGLETTTTTTVTGEPPPTSTTTEPPPTTTEPPSTTTEPPAATAATTEPPPPAAG
ncbi:MAG TPA: peptidoglycan DD-metalloendopeptidase family protein [Acidimicrobiales bacterium]|nr:peptidoglycan DD-metalloendopeptidase family protein [Acidimicrobiales bacterium]